MRSRPWLKHVPALLGGLVGVSIAGSAQAQSNAQGLLDNSWVFNLGAFVVGSDLSAGLNGSSRNNPTIDFDKNYGRADDATRIRGDVLWRITPVHHLRFMYFNNDTTRSRVLDNDVQWGDYTFKAGSRSDLQYKFEVSELAYEWGFLKTPTYELAASFGLHYSKTTLQLSGTATVTDANGQTGTASAASKASSLPAPLPVIGLRGGWLLAPNWYLDGQAQFFKVNIDGYDGRWSDLRLGATWMFAKNFGVGLGYNRFGTRVDVDRNNFGGTLKASYSGLQAYLTGTF
ncbi:hypothetical protein [Roseateles violae]|uniref:Outer membrane protein beta-barrel domain-containing protein n=1 Tax=Roseateles violae TaxID=3058042 RepID=A0ABT8DPJ5_9BURK|nr:hypothetical protein [Pelomonas sp. PFR6]MDN3920260.1 hypothetical protein [Pelomonas sp. PFR6]